MPLLKPSELQHPDQVIRTHHVTGEDIKIQDMLKPDYWKLAAPHLRLSDRIKVEASDGSFFAELSVRDLGKIWARVKACYVVSSRPGPGRIR